MNRIHHIIFAAAIAHALALFLVFCVGPAFAWDVTIAWDSNSEPDLNGYTLYYSKHSAGPPYEFVGDLPLSTFNNPDYPSTIVTNLEDGVDYFFAMTAYDTDGNESAFSNYLCARRDGQSILDCTPPSSSSLSAGGGSASGGCFVQSASGSTGNSYPAAFLLALLGLPITLSIILPISCPKWK